MSYLIESWNLSMADKKAFRCISIEAGIHRSLNLSLARVREELVVWGLSNSDVGLTGWTFNPQTAGDWNTWIKYQNTVGGVMVIIKVTILFPLTPRLNGIKFCLECLEKERSFTKAGYSLGQLYGISPLLQAIQQELTIDRLAGVREKLEGWPVMEGYFSEPIVYDPQDIINIDLFCESTNSVGLVLGGFIVRNISTLVI